MNQMLFARAILLIKNLKIEKPKPTFIISVLKVEHWVTLVSWIFNFFNYKIALANKWMRKIIPSCSNSALIITVVVMTMFVKNIFVKTMFIKNFMLVKNNRTNIRNAIFICIFYAL
jgi:hypothetical protein